MYEGVPIALENIITDKVSTVPITRQKKFDTSAPLEIGMVMKDDGEGSREEGDHRIVDLTLQAVCKGTGRGSWSA